MNITQKRTDTILNYLQEHHDLQHCDDYGECGYHTPETGILFCDWNPINRTTCDYLEEAGYGLEWSDEWYIDYDNNKAWRTAPDSYEWICPIAYCDGYILTPDDDISEWIEKFTITDHRQPMGALPDWISADDIKAGGFTLIDMQYENGLHYGQNDSLQVIAKDHLKRYESVLFQIDNVGQFACRFILYVGAER